MGSSKRPHRKGFKAFKFYHRMALIDVYAKIWSSLDVKGDREICIIDNIELNYLHEQVNKFKDKNAKFKSIINGY